MNDMTTVLNSALARELVERALAYPGQVEWHPPYLVLAGGVMRHTDSHHPRFSAFLTIRNDGCRIWQRNGYRGVPKVGERFVLNIHELHGVSKCSKDKVLIVLCADAESEEEARALLTEAEATIHSRGGQ